MSPYESSIKEARETSQNESLIVHYESKIKEKVNAAAHVIRSCGRGM